MAQTVIGIFKNSTEAENAKELLLQKGFTREMVDISTQTGTTIPGSSNTGEEEDLGDKISRFFNNLFGNENEGAKYAKAASGGTVVTVHAQTTEQAETAANILDDYGAVDVDEYASAYGAGTTDQNSISGSADVDRMGGMNSGRVGMINPSPSGTGTPIPENQTGGPASEEKPEITPKEFETGDQRSRSRIVDRPVDETSRLRPEQVNVGGRAEDEETEGFGDGFIEVTEYSEMIIIEEPDDEGGFNEVDRKQEAVRETLRSTEDEPGKPQTPEATEGDKTGQEHHVKDDPHHQRPGIV